MNFYDASKPLYLEKDASGIGLVASLLQIWYGMYCGCNEAPDNAALHPIVFASTSLSSAEWQCSSIKREALGILHGLEKFHKQLVAMISKDVVMFS